MDGCSVAPPSCLVLGWLGYSGFSLVFGGGDVSSMRVSLFYGRAVWALSAFPGLGGTGYHLLFVKAVFWPHVGFLLAPRSSERWLIWFTVVDKQSFPSCILLVCARRQLGCVLEARTLLKKPVSSLDIEFSSSTSQAQVASASATLN